MKFRNMSMLVALAGTMALGGCQMAGFQNDGYEPFTPEELHPIDVVSGTSRITVPVRKGHLDERGEKLVRRFGAEVAAMPTRVVVVRPAGVNGGLAAARATMLLKEQGVAPQRIRVVSGGKTRDLIISTHRKFAVTRECGDWSRSVGATLDNRPYPNYGCAQQHNIAAMVANPEDLDHPRPMRGPDADRSVRAVSGR